MRGRLLWLSAISVPLWWFFEAVNRLVRNWEYVIPYPIFDLHYIAEASIYFSTVVPAVLSTAFAAYRMLNCYAPALKIGPVWRVRPEYLVPPAVFGTPD